MAYGDFLLGKKYPVDPQIRLVSDISKQFEVATGTSWLMGKSHGATAFLPNGKYPVELKEEFPYGVIAQRSIPGSGFWDFEGKIDGTEFRHRYTLKSSDGSRTTHTDIYRVIRGINKSTVERYRKEPGF